MYIPRSSTQALIADAPRKGPLSRGKIIMIIFAAVVLVMTIGLSFFAIEKMFSLKYEQAVALMDSNDLLKAKEEFLILNGYRDSPEKARECQDRYDFDIANTLLKAGDYVSARKIFAALGNYGEAPEKVKECDYEAAMALMNLGKLQEAKLAFRMLGSFSDSEAQADKCQKEMDYIAAVDLLDRQDYVNALDAFRTLNTYKDSPDKAQECMDCLYGADYAAAIKLLRNKDYKNALTAFKSLGYYKDSADKAQECQNNLDYIEADKAYKDKLFYTAYVAFSLLGDFSDSAERAARCVQKSPKSGQIYRNPRYKSSTSTVMFKAPKSEYSTCLKIYNGNTLVSTVFVASGKNATISLPAGAYTIKKATGTKWYGSIEAFGTNVSFKTFMSDAVVNPHKIYILNL